MRRKIKGISIKILILMILLFCMTGCGREDAGMREEPGLQDEVEVLENIDEQQEVQETDIIKGPAPTIKEIPVDFPYFYESDSYSLTLARLKEPEGEYELRFYDGDGKILQQISCGMLTEPLRFSYDAFYSGEECLEIFPAKGNMGLLFGWIPENERFLDNAIEIPKYVENRGSTMLVVEDDETLQVKKIYQLNQFQKCSDEVRRWQLQKDTGVLEIWDCLEEKSLFDGSVRLDENGNPQNTEYYDMLLWENCYWLWDYQEDTTVRIWLDEPRTESTDESQGIESFEYVQKELFGNDGHAEEYESREAFLADFGLQDSAPMYQYYDQFHNLQLELYQDKTLEHFLGIVYKYYFDDEKKKNVEMYGFTINSIQEAVWADKITFLAGPVSGNSVTREESIVHKPEEIIGYTPSGRLDYYRCLRVSEWERYGEVPGQTYTAISINYIYRDDGSLFYRDYWHDPLMFGTTLQSMESYYDEAERVVFESGYITHGELEYYYIYEGKKDIPKYCLQIDHNMGYAIPEMVRYY